MARSSREINIFSMSTLDVIFGALGAFLILMITAFANQADEDKDVEEVRREQQLAIAVIEWSGSADVDLWLEANGRLYGPKAHLYPDRAAKASAKDATTGGIESQAIVKASGTYKVHFRLQDLKQETGPVTVTGWFVSNSSTGSYSTHFFGRIPLGRDDLGRLVEISSFELDGAGDLESYKSTYWDNRKSSGSN